jgi:amino acid transporter
MDKDVLVKGIKYMALAFPFIFATPIVLTASFSKADEGNYLLLIIALVLMGITFFLAIKGLRTILKAMFDNNAQ